MHKNSNHKHVSKKVHYFCKLCSISDIITGEIVYSTCTIEKEENETVTDSFTADNENFEKVFEKTFYPHIDNTDGFYICKMKRIK